MPLLSNTSHTQSKLPPLGHYSTFNDMEPIMCVIVVTYTVFIYHGGGSQQKKKMMMMMQFSVSDHLFPPFFLH